MAIVRDTYHPFMPKAKGAIRAEIAFVKQVSDVVPLQEVKKAAFDLHLSRSGARRA
jgi:hypothetical protein